MLLSVPRYLWRDALIDLLTFLRAALRADEARRFAAETRLLWLSGYVRESWFRHSPDDVVDDSAIADTSALN